MIKRLFKAAPLLFVPAFFLWAVGSVVGGADATEWDIGARQLYVFVSFVCGLILYAVGTHDDF